MLSPRLRKAFGNWWEHSRGNHLMGTNECLGSPSAPTGSTDNRAALDEDLKQMLSRLMPPLPLPPGETEESLYRYLGAFRVEGAPPEELKRYVQSDFRRFVYTLGLVPQQAGDALEIGANPYFTSILLQRFTKWRLTFTNYFGSSHPRVACETVISEASRERLCFEYHNINVESTDLRSELGREFDLVLFCEVIEHLTNDPLGALLRINEVLRPSGVLVLTTPNVARLANVAKLLAGVNIYDPYSGYGAYGRHNREYNRHELVHLLAHAGFEVEVFFTADVLPTDAHHFCDLAKVLPLVSHRAADLGHYHFCRARKRRRGRARKPSWLYRSYPPEQMVEVQI